METTRSRGDRYALSALIRRRATLASEIIQLEGQLRHRKESLMHVDATLMLLDPSINVGAIPNKRPTKRIKLFRHGELGRMILDVLRQTGGSASAQEIVTALLAVGGHGEDARKAVAGRVRGNLAYLERRRAVAKYGTGRNAEWSIST